MDKKTKTEDPKIQEHGKNPHKMKIKRLEEGILKDIYSFTLSTSSSTDNYITRSGDAYIYGVALDLLPLFYR